MCKRIVPDARDIGRSKIIPVFKELTVWDASTPLDSQSQHSEIHLTLKGAPGVTGAGQTAT